MTTIDTIDHDDWLAGVREQLVASTETYHAQLTELTAKTPDPADVDTHAALLAAARQSLADATQAVRRIDANQYGTCEACGDAIPRARLEILPQARHCVGCQSRVRA